MFFFVTVHRGLGGMVVPSKLYPILAAGRPVLAVVSKESDVAKIVTRNKCGIVADPDDPSSVTSAVRTIMTDQARLEKMSMYSRAIAPVYKQEQQLNRFVKLIEKVTLR